MNDRPLDLSSGRTGRTIRNAAIGVSLVVGMMILQFVSRRVFIEYLSVEILGLNTMVRSLLEFLNTAELGIGTAIGFSIYKPLADNDMKTVREIMGIHKWLYRKVAGVVLLSAGALVCFFPHIFHKSGLPAWYAYSTFGVMLFSALAGYVWNYRQVLLSASQREDKVQIAYRLPKCIQNLLQILCIIVWPEQGYVLWLILEVAGTMAATLMLNRFVRGIYPDLVDRPLPGSLLRKKYPEVLVKIRQLMFHKIGGFIVRQMNPVLIYAYLSLSVVAVYGNYILITSGINRLVEGAFRGMEAVVGNVAHTSAPILELRVFDELNALRFYIGAVAMFGFLECAAPFTLIWVGPGFTLEPGVVILLGAILFLGIYRGTVETFVLARGIVGDIWAPIAEGLLSLSLSVILGHLYSLPGVLAGGLAGQSIFVLIWKPYYFFKCGHPSGSRVLLINFWLRFVKFCCLAAGASLAALCISSFFQPGMAEGDAGLTSLLRSVLISMIFAVVLLLAMIPADSGAGRLASRFVRLRK